MRVYAQRVWRWRGTRGRKGEEKEKDGGRGTRRGRATVGEGAGSGDTDGQKAEGHGVAEEDTATESRKDGKRTPRRVRAVSRVYPVLLTWPMEATLGSLSSVVRAVVL